MQNLDLTAEELFNKIRGRFPSVTIGDAEGNVTNEPTQARYFDFNFVNEGRPVGKVSVSLDEKSVAVVYGEDLVANETEMTRNNWYDFLKELRMFAKKRALTFDTRDITKSNLDSRDYKFLAKNRGGDENMNESKLYGTSRVSYQDFDGARLMIKHTESVNTELATGRTQKVGAIYIESAEGERFKYPYKHLSGARAMARHVAEGGKPYDDFGSHITGLSEELAKLRKFKTYMGRSAVMAESLSEYMDVVKERIATVKKTVESLQKPSYYKETFDSFEKPMFEDVPEDVAENWIDQLTIKQFNEELADVFPYIYKLVSEATRAEEVSPEDLVDEGERHGNDKMYDKCWDGYKKVPGKKRGEKGSCVKEEDELEAAFEASMGQFAEGNDEEIEEAYIKTSKDAIDTLGNLRKIGKSIETGQETYDGNLANMYVNDVYDVISWVENNLDTNDSKYTQVMEPVLALRKKAKGMERESGSGKDARFGNEIVNTLYPLMQWIENANSTGESDDDAMDVKITPDGGIEKADMKEQKTPLGEFILSYYDREAGEFPKGETAILTMVEKDYGEQYINPAKEFIERVYEVTDQHRMKENRPDDGGLGVVEKLLQGITKDFVNGDDKAAEEMVAMLKKYNAPMDKVADMLEQKAKELTKKTFSIFDNPLKKTPAGDAADRMLILADYIRSKAGQSEEFDRMRELAGLR